MKKKILVVFTGAMHLGGIERSLIGLLDAIDYELYDVDLFLYAHHGALCSQINEKVNILPEVKELAYLRESFGQKLRHGAFYSAWRRMVDGMSHISPEKSWRKTMFRCVPKLQKEYDLALGFFRPFDVITELVQAKVKVGWIHTDYSSAEDASIPELREAYKKVDIIAAVSDSCGKTFTKILPEYTKKMKVVENILPEKLIKYQADILDVSKEMPNNNSIRLLTIGRFSYQKRMDEIPQICRYLIRQGLNIKWYLIGYGGDEMLIRQKIKEAHMENNVIVLGEKNNPYPYIKACDIYVQPSRYEGKCVAVREAQMLGKPVIITNYATASSQLEDGVDGVIVPMDIEGCAKGIGSVIKDMLLQKKIVDNCKQRDYSNAQEIQRLYDLILK